MINMLKVLVAVFILIMIIAFAVLGKKTGKFFQFQTAKGKEESAVIMWIAAALTAGVSLMNYIANKPEPSTMKLIGLYIFFMGGIIQITTKKTILTMHEEALKQNFHKATTMRLFDRVRHPSKTALFCMVLGTSLTLGSAWGTVMAIALFLPALLFRISQEETILLDEFGNRYYDYQDETKKILPFIL